MLKKMTIKMSLAVLFLMVVSFFIPAKITQAKTAVGHIVFSEKEMKQRIAEIKNYYYKQPKKLTKKSIEYRDKYSDEAVIRFDYYLHGKDLMFAYGVETKQKTEYRLYFYKDQIIKVLIDKKGKKRQTHDQFYVKFDSTFYDENLIYYLDLENFFRITVAELFKKTPRTKSDGYIFITDISYKNNKSITYHTGNGYGSDGVMISLDTEAYTAKLAKNVKVRDYTESPDEYKALTLESLYREFSGYYIPAGITVKNGQVVEIELPYQP